MLARLKFTTTDERAYSVPSGVRTILHAIYIANTTTTRRLVRLHHVRNGETSSTSNALFYDVAIAPNGTLIDSTRIPMHEGDELRGLADAAGVTLTLYGTEQ
jgi:hypothetical protein